MKTAYLASLTDYIVTFLIQTNKNLWNWLQLTSIKSMFFCVCKQNNRPSGISRLACLSVSLTAGTNRLDMDEYRHLCFGKLRVF